jgi:HSP20 family protein
VQWVTSERFTGTFQRQVALGDGLATDNIAASDDDGVLTVTLPVAQQAKPRKISVAASESQLKAVNA